ncbi:hypothetical protein BDBG_03327 [Blastomyces gilchristii SLH14081]|uniref:DUF7924 domain-containing protein n=1 Tax=Blastomyces gilchristii (strain SLH14081) TaxID=559298 RepID=A0A179UHA8_BLAGS|nr:uncharacterized protein BDBG_03327 [Blastomyces gilchristii SLH14081]OAT07240.1 hypothetical protein BDBG_03327 [Blastomyces gilchristii SLH14081]
MAPRRKPNVRKVGPQPSVRQSQEKRPQGIKKYQVQKVVRKSARLEQLQVRAVSKDRSTEQRQPSPSLASNLPIKSPQKVQTIPQDGNQKRKRPQEAKDRLQNPGNLFQKRPRTSRLSSTVKNIPSQEATSNVSGIEISPIRYWIQTGHWPRKDSKQGSSMNSLLARKKSTSSLRRKGSESSAATPSDEKPREEKSAPYKHRRYEILLRTKGSFMRDSDTGITDESILLYQSLLDTEQLVPTDSRFQDDLFTKTCEMVRLRNEAKVIMDIGQLIVPSAETLALYGATNLDILIEGFNEAWSKCIPFYGPCPQPDYCVGFRQSAFTHGQLEKLQPFIGSWTHTSLLMATDTMYFPFLACEVKCGEVALEVADRQNAHSMTVAVRGVIELYRAVKREQELHREILAFSISHDHTTVRIYGHYALVKEKQTTFYRRPIRKFDFTEQDGKERWTAYKFTRNIYDIWIPTHLKRIHSAIDQISSELDLDVSQTELQFSQRSNAESFEDEDRQSSFIGSADIAPSTSFTQVPEQPPKQFKKPRKK